MPDRKPPRLVGDERGTLHALLQYHRESLVRKVEGVNEDDARRHLVNSDTTLHWLLKHTAGAAARWVLATFAGETEPIPEDGMRSDDTVASAVQRCRDIWARVDAVVATSDLEATCRSLSDDDTVNLRWIVTHLLEETARQAGHADILRELIDGQTGR